MSKFDECILIPEKTFEKYYRKETENVLQNKTLPVDLQLKIFDQQKYLKKDKPLVWPIISPQNTPSLQIKTDTEIGRPANPLPSPTPSPPPSPSHHLDDKTPLGKKKNRKKKRSETADLVQNAKSMGSKRKKKGRNSNLWLTQEHYKNI